MTQEFPLCKLCHANRADKKGSHVIPLFLLSTMLTENGKARGREISVRISSTQFSKFQIGREVNPDKINEILGRDYQESDAENNVNFYVRDNFLCSGCEDRLAILEGIVSSEVYQSIDTFPLERGNEFEVISVPIKQNSLFRWLILSILWRCGITEFNGMKLPQPYLDRIRTDLDGLLSNRKETLINNLEIKKASLYEYYLSIFFKEKIEKNNYSVYFHPPANSPYYFIFNEFIIAFYNKKKSIKGSFSEFWGFNKFLRNEFFTKKYFGKIVIIPNEFQVSLKEKMIANYVSKLGDFHKTAVKLLFFKHTGNQIDEATLNRFIAAYADSPKSIDKLSQKNFLNFYETYFNGK